MTARYHPIHKLASGGMADVYLGVQSSSLGFRRLVAIKKIKPAFAKDDDFLIMFRDEANVCQYLQHSNIVQIVDFAPLDDTVAIVLEFIPGINLLEFLNAHRTMGIQIPVPAVLHIFCEVLKALAYVHERMDPSTGESLGIIHRDLTPTNVIISGEGEVKLTDFGIAKARDNQHLTQAGTMKGKLNYVSPEQFDGLDLDHRTDIYSAGLLLWEMLTGKRLYHAQSETELVKLLSTHNVERNPRAIRKDLDDDICSIAMTAIAIDRDARYGTARELLKTMRSYVNQNVLPDFELTAYVRRIMAKELLDHRQLIQKVLSAGRETLLAEAESKQTASASQDKNDSQDQQRKTEWSVVQKGSAHSHMPTARLQEPTDKAQIDTGQTSHPMQMAAGDFVSLDLPSLPRKGQYLADPVHSTSRQPGAPRAIYTKHPVKSASTPSDRPPLSPRRVTHQGTPPIFFYAQGIFVSVTFILIIFRHEVREIMKSILALFK